ncbi:hypothetical protein B0H10DRAFT_2245516 [Mycena sp. CBHHK59/15]|nr:hypothetical protein B0H10DRAFT_2245516 [Mycena sp. CBHHK59/15]
MSSQIPGSSGPLRHSNSPRRIHHYELSQRTPRHRRSDSDSENSNPSSHMADLHFPQYDSRSQNSGLRSAASFSYNSLDDHYSPVVNIDKLANEAHLSSAHRLAAHAFSKLNTEDRIITCYIQGLQNDEKIDSILSSLDATNKGLATIGTFMNETWALTSNQEKILKALLKHYLIMPHVSYRNITGHVQSYILRHLVTLHLGLYKSDPTVKRVINVFLGQQNNNIKSAFRKLIFNSVEQKMALKSFGMKILNAYHLPDIPDIVPQATSAAFALMRDVAAPLVAHKTERMKGADTGFWQGLEDALEKLYDAHGNDRKSSAWLQWENNIIAQDNSRYKRTNAGDQAHTRTEVDNALLGLPMGHLVDIDNNGDADGDAGGAWDVSLADLGNMAATATL